MAELTIEARGLVKRFGRKTALDGLDLAVEPGQVVAVLGPNGAGKTTFVRAVATLLRLDGGTLRVAGFDVRREPEEVRRAIGLAGQYASVEPAMTGRENLEMVARLYGQPARTARTSAARVLERFGLAGDADRLARTYSGGMRRKLDLGASLVSTPRLLLLDEPTTGLDPRSRIELWDAIDGLVEQGTDVLLTTQYLDEAERLAGHIVIIDHGRAVASGPPAELKRRVGGNVLEVHVRDRADLAAVAAALAHPGHAAPQVDEATRRVSVGAGDGDAVGGLLAGLRAVEDTGVELSGVSVRQPGLEEVFLALTGQDAVDGTLGARGEAMR
ncbi:daunorubicin resistance protein DrrA family ABC transporter ATP-binding protein [Streptosporangium roseum]|uniref:Daunorubicin resistance ABC transporter ATP-binding subunit n=1 Tax=Streptosporangium roseum (strain ATCC 12428 / DSM 43021 / JCM 3005 / KCTC 9067 / NCIMB 10171 / NRRL 2505 / NI 9100) TaxID=479432 RepID=D2AY78_STRRD|nr:daunorubicin resistance protein DrrA family ABC transporter ATP-binding protein [Streptosporangium roseum]ACZ87088.1 daunorubicin resistance ABC transporter ATP- binding subunit [Streptosporangium roseum DSM 43021]